MVLVDDIKKKCDCLDGSVRRWLEALYQLKANPDESVTCECGCCNPNNDNRIILRWLELDTALHESIENLLKFKTELEAEQWKLESLKENIDPNANVNNNNDDDDDIPPSPASGSSGYISNYN